jgi:hypothetical protein
MVAMGEGGEFGHEVREEFTTASSEQGREPEMGSLLKLATIENAVFGEEEKNKESV